MARLQETKGANSINTSARFILYFLVAVSSEPAAHLASVCICSNSLAADYRSLPAWIRRSVSTPHRRSPFSSLFSHFLSVPIPFPPCPSFKPPRCCCLTRLVRFDQSRFVAAQCHVTTLEACRKRTTACRSQRDSTCASSFFPFVIDASYILYKDEKTKLTVTCCYIAQVFQKYHNFKYFSSMLEEH